jgi:hypothetical protein
MSIETHNHLQSDHRVQHLGLLELHFLHTLKIPKGAHHVVHTPKQNDGNWFLKKNPKPYWIVCTHLS